MFLVMEFLYWWKSFIMLFIKRVIIVFCFLFSCSFALEYDGLWFLGFNIGSESFQGEEGKALRYYINYAIDKKKLVSNLDGVVPNDIVPKGMLGYDEKASLPVTVLEKKRAISLVVLMTDGLFTNKVFTQIADDLKVIGVTLVPEIVSYSKPKEWQQKLTESNYDLYFMGYKTFGVDDPYQLLMPLFSSAGEVNFMNYKSANVDAWLTKGSLLKDEVSKIKYLEKSKWQIISDLPIVPIFYIKNIKEFVEN